jgi:DNA polymerase I-like protein with 3'-5' exonuclease and polymerase domains
MHPTKLPEFMSNPDPDIYYGKGLCLDFETTNIESGTALNEDNRLLLAVWKVGDGPLMYKRGGELEQQELVAACNEADFLIAHNAKFELQWLHRCGYDIGSRPVWCTMVGEWVLAGNRKWRLNLDSCLERRGLPLKDQTISRLIKGGVCPSEIPKDMLLKYGAWDVDLTHQLFLQQRDVDMDGTRLVPVQYTRCLVTPALADMERNGLHLDATKVEKVYNEYEEEYNRVMYRLDQIAEGVNPRSPAQVAHFLYGTLGFEEKKDKSGNPIRNAPTKQFPDGQPKTDEATLLSLGAKTEAQKEFLALKKEQAGLASALDKNLAMFLGACKEKDGMIYASINQGRTVTHRLASSGRSTQYEMFDKPKGCQFQNLPRKFKDLFSPRNEGWLIAEADGSQLEYRVAGHVGNEPKINEEVHEGYDVHRFTASVMNQVTEDEVDHYQRTAAKADTFKPLFGGQSGTKRQKAYYKAFAEKYNQLRFTQDSWVIEVANTKKLQTEWGMTFHFPYAKYEGDWLNCKTNVYNIPIQSFATADIIPIALAYCWHRTRDLEMFLVNTVHDSIEAEFPPHERELFEEIAVQSLTHDVYEYLDSVYDVQFSVPLGVGMVIGKHWGVPLEGEDEITVQVETPYSVQSEMEHMYYE